MLRTIVYFLLILVEVVSALLLIGAVLMQRGKGQGLGLAFGAGMGESLFGAQVGNVLTRATVIIAVVFLLNTTLLSLFQTRRPETSVTERLPAAAPAVPISMPAMTETGLPLPMPMVEPAPGVPADAQRDVPALEWPAEVGPGVVEGEAVVPVPDESAAEEDRL